MQPQFEEMPPLHGRFGMIGRLISLPIFVVVLTVYLLLTELW